VKYVLRLWKVEGKKKTLVLETDFNSEEVHEIAEQAGSLIEEAVEVNG